MKESQLKEDFKVYDFQKWKSIFDFVFDKVEYFAKPANPFTENNKVVSGRQYGRIVLADNKALALFEVEVDNNINIERNRQGLREIAAKHIDQNITHGALVFYYSKEQQDYRLTFIAKWSDLDSETGGLVKTETQKKRYTYLLGGNQSGTTAAKRLKELAAKKPGLTIKNITDAFSVEPVKKEFFKKYKEHYEKFWHYIDSEPRYQKLLIDDTKEKEDDKKKPIRDFIKKLLGRVVFLHFLQKKGWMGCPVLNTKKDNDDIWEGGDPDFMLNLFNNYQDKEHFYSKCLAKLFFNTLNAPGRKNNEFELTGTRVPYLNGGLFDNDQQETDKIDFDQQLFEDLFAFFGQYNFTIDENSAEEQEIGIDPEMLGHIFENLLEENREKGAFYTPKEIVHYMCQESLVQYLNNHFPEEAEIAHFIRKDVPGEYLKKKEHANKLDELLDKVKICDPAIGSGAFPIGMLQELFEAKLYIYPHLKNNKDFDRTETKKQIIQNSIYGVDLEHGAVEIARLRFWLWLVVDEAKPQPLPNLDYKIMQGNSLLEKFEGVDLSKVGSTDDNNHQGPQKDLFGRVIPQQLKTTVINPETAKQIQKLTKKYYVENNPIEKASLKEQINLSVHKHIDDNLSAWQKEIEQSIADAQNGNSRLSAKDKKKLEEWEKELENFKQKRERLHKVQNSVEKPYFIWHLFFKDVFDNGGFDIVIGNPPYIQLQKLGKDTDVLQEVGFDTFIRTGDLYCLFYEKGFDILKRKGILTYISSNKWMRGAYGKKLRNYFSKKNSLKIINLGPGIFLSATVDTNIYVGKNESSINQTKAIEISERNDIVSLQDKDMSPLADTGENAWVLLDNHEIEISEGFSTYGKALKEWTLDIYRGILTGYNDGFLLNEAEKDELISIDSNNAKIIKPVVRGREVEKYYINDIDDYIILTHNGIREQNILPVDINEYPSIRRHLESETHWEHVLKRQDQGITPFNLRNCAYLFEFGKEKVIWKRIGSQMRFAYSDEELYCLDSTCIATGEKIKYLTAVLNSKVGLYQLFKTSPQTGTGDQIISVQALEPLLVHYPTPEIEDKFNRLVDIILFIKKSKQVLVQSTENDFISLDFESVVDQMAFELYFKKHMEELKIDITNEFDFPDISICKNELQKKDAVLKSWYDLTTKNNTIRNKILVSENRSWIIKKINQTVI